MKLTREQGNAIVWDDDENWEPVEGTEKPLEQRRWVTRYSQIFKHVPTGKFYKLYYELGSTEEQHQQPFEYADPNPIEVELKDVMVKKWVNVPGNYSAH